MALQYTYNPDGSIKSVVSAKKDKAQNVASELPSEQTLKLGGNSNLYPVIVKYREDGSIKSAVSQEKPANYVDPYTPLPTLGYSIPNTALNKINAKEEMFGSLRSMLKKPGVLTQLDRQMIADQMQEIRDFNNQKFDPITGQSGKRNIEDFKKFIRMNKKGFLRDEGQFEGFRGGGMKSFNEFLNDLQEGKIDELSPEELQFIDDLKNNRVD